MLDNRVYTLLKVCECGSFVAASEKLNITQPAVSQHIRSLEEELGIKIFERSRSGIVLTKQGEIAVDAAKKLAAIYAGLRDTLASGAALTGNLTVGVTHTAESNPISEALARYCAPNPGTKIKMITDTISDLYSKLKTYEIDLAIVEGRIRDPAIKYLLMDTDYLVLAVATDHPLARKSMVTLEELKKERMILRLPSSGTRNLFEAHLESNNMAISDFNVVLEVDNIATIKDLIRRNFGVSVMARSACLDELKKGKIATLPVENLSMMREINIAYLADFSRLDLLRDIVNSYNETVRLYM